MWQKSSNSCAIYVKLASTHHTVVQLDYQAMEWRKQHFLTSLMVISSATLSFSLPLFLRKKWYIHHSFHGSIMLVNLKKGTYVCTGRKNWWLPMLCWSTVGRNSLTGRANSLEQNGDFQWNTYSRAVRLSSPYTWRRRSPPYSTRCSGGVLRRK